jgi:sulfate permease, SulP family
VGDWGSRLRRVVPRLFPTIWPWRGGSPGPELLAGLLLAAIAVPEQIATARLAGMPTTAGLAAFIFGSLAIACFGRTGPLSVGGDSTIAPVIAASVTSIAAASSATYRADASLLALMVGLLVALIGLLRMAWLADILSAPVVTGFLAGVGIAIVLRQLPVIFGISLHGQPGQLEGAWQTLRSLNRANGWTIGIAAVVIVGVGGADRWNRRFPGALLALVATTAVVGGAGLKSHGVAVLGVVPAGLPHFAVPQASFAALRKLILPALAIALVVLAQSAATVRGLGSSAAVEEDFSKDLVGIGAGSLLAGFTASFAVDASPPRTAIVSDAGGRTQLAGLSAAAIVLVLAALAASLLDDVPHATLGAILALIGARLVRASQLRGIYRFDRIEFGLSLVTLVVVAAVNVEVGMALAVVLAVIDRTRRTARPRGAILGRVPGTSSWVDVQPGVATEQVPGVVVYALLAPVWFANADNVVARLRAIASSNSDMRSFVLDAVGISDIDYTGGRALTGLMSEFLTAGTKVAVARASPNVTAELERIGFASVVGDNSFYASVEEAVEGVSGVPSTAS